jgi:8-oxo-dGTP pyrophosphatase MutT (NUDIX family)
MIDPPVPGADIPREAVAPRPAASLVLLRAQPDDPAAPPDVLMGRRPATARFMPGVYVFPGGAVDASDADHAERLIAGGDMPPAALLRTAETTEARALMWAALRETWEETGILVGRAEAGTAGDAPPPCPAAEAYRTAGMLPAADTIHYVARAITPPISPIRFDTRFFLAFAADSHGEARASGELPAVEWVSADWALDSEKVRGVSKFVLRHALALLAEGGRPAPDRLVPRFTYEGERRVVVEE